MGVTVKLPDFLEGADRLTIPDYANANGVMLDYESVKAAIEFMGVKKPVKIKWSSGQRTNGTARFNDERHTITVSRYLYGHDVSRVIFHELTHSAQYERFGSYKKFAAEYKKYSALGYGYSKKYRENPYEVEARDNEAYATEYPLVK